MRGQERQRGGAERERGRCGEREGAERKRKKVACLVYLATLHNKANHVDLKWKCQLSSSEVNEGTRKYESFSAKVIELKS